MSEQKVGLVRLDAINFHQHNVRRDLGDLRDLTDSIRRFGVMQPVVLEDNGDRLRIRAGHRRVAAARLAGLSRIPALIHTDALDDDEWLVQAVHENTRRKGLNLDDRADTVKAMRAAGVSWEGVAEAFGASVATVRSWKVGPVKAAAEQRQCLHQKVSDLTAEGRSAAQIADTVGLSARQVVRIRQGKPNAGAQVTSRALRTFIDAWRGSGASLAEALDALAVLADECDVRNALPQSEAS